MKKEPLTKGLKNKSSKKYLQEPIRQQHGYRYYNLTGLSIIILSGIIIYSNSFSCGFHFDDFPNIVNNTKIQLLSHVKAWWNFYPSRPAGIFTFALNYHFNHLDVWYYHLVNLVIHLINACLVWWLTLQILSLPVLKQNSMSNHKKVIAFFTAILFVSHPLATQSVTYIVQRLAALVTLFYIMSLLLYLKARVTDRASSKTLLFAGSFLSAVLAMLTKENAFTLPFAIALLELFFLRTKKLSVNFRDYRIILFLIASLSVLLIIPLKYSINIFKTIPANFVHPYTLTPFTYLLTQFSVIVKYIQLLFLPVNQNLDYDFPVSDNFFEIRTVLCFLVIVFLIFLAIFLYKKNRVISFGIFWFFLTLSIESSIIPIDDVIFEHRTYLPSIGFFLVVTTAIVMLLRNKNKYAAIVILTIIAVSNSYATYQRNKVWKDDLTLWSDVIAKSPGKARPLEIRGYTYANMGEWDKAIEDYSASIRKSPKYTEAFSYRGAAYDNTGQYDEAIADYSVVLGIDPNAFETWSNRGVVYCKLKEWDKAIADFTRSIKINPKYKEAYSNRGIAYCNLGLWDRAIADYSRTIEIDPNYADGYNNRGNAYGTLGQWEAAVADYSRALEIDPNFTEAYSNREIVYKKLQSDRK